MPDDLSLALERAVILLELNGKETEKEIKKRYRTFAKAFHPDSATGDNERFKELQEAYDLLTFHLTRGGVLPKREGLGFTHTDDFFEVKVG